MIKHLILFGGILLQQPTLALDHTDCLQQLTHLFRSQKHYHPSGRFTTLTKTPQFQSYLRNSVVGHWESLNLKQKYQHLWSFVRQGLNRYQLPEQLLTLREASLQKALNAIGVKALPQDLGAYQTLTRISHDNLQKQLALIPSHDLIDPEVEQFVNTLSLNPVHNSLFKGNELLSPLLSSQQIELLTGRGGLNSLYDFNKNFTGQSDQIYFFPNFGKPETRRFSHYGRTEITLSSSESEFHAWISPYVMTESDLLDFGIQTQSPNHITPDHPAWSYHKINWDQSDKSSPTQLKLQSAWNKLKKDQNTSVYTVRDFENLLRTQLNRALTGIKKTNPSLYEEYVLALTQNEFKSSDLIQMLETLNDHRKVHMRFFPSEYVLYELVYKPLKMPRIWELKVPVAIQPSELTVRSLAP